jgi:CRP-like cAMP-binding protein
MIADKLNIVTFDDGDIIFQTNQDAHRMYFIAKGVVCIRDQKQIALATLAGDDFFGEEALFNDKPRTYEAISVGPTTLLTLSRTNLLAIISECPSVAVGFLQVFSSTLTCRQFFNKKGNE